MKKVQRFTETFHEYNGHWLGYRCDIAYDSENHRILMNPTRSDGDYYCWTGTAKPGQRDDYPLFGDATGARISIEVGLASGFFSEDAGNIHIFIAYCPTGSQYLTLWSRSSVRACDLTPEGVVIQAYLTEPEWPEQENTQNFGLHVDRAYVFGHLNEIGITHHKPWNGKDDGVIWFDNVSIDNVT